VTFGACGVMGWQFIRATSGRNVIDGVKTDKHGEDSAKGVLLMDRSRMMDGVLSAGCHRQSARQRRAFEFSRKTRTPKELNQNAGLPPEIFAI
jgi:hypothetical protein